ncbi:hypothetical protein Scep_013936 [Stephania cephalantha]|uniref:Annexin n=1 Tax=Stephania cephalantha TaxID=152367 RepID=A0AAP0J138_9MAGN
MATLFVPDQVPSAVEDAEIIRNAVKGWGTDEKTLISVLAHRNAAQRKQIKQAYEELYGENLIKRLETEISGNFEKAMYRWLLDPIDREAVLAHVALKNGDYSVIVETATVLSPDELLEVKRAYQFRYKRSLEEDVATNTSGDIRKLLVALVGVYKYNGVEIDARVAKHEATVLNDMIAGKAFNHEELIRILSTRSKEQLRATFNNFREDHGNNITKRIVGDPTDEYLAALRTTVRCLRDPMKYFVKVLSSAIKRAGSDEDTLTRIVVTHAEKDLEEIKEEYYKRYSASVDQDVAKETSGHYEGFLLALLGSEKH